MTTEYKMEIQDCEWVSEIIDEIFDGVLDSLLPNSVVYGGAVRDVLAGMKIEGDLDVSINNHEFKNLVRTFKSHPKWIDASIAGKQSEATEIARKSEDITATTTSIAAILGKRDPYVDEDGRPHTPIKNIAEFRNVNNRTLQVISTEAESFELLKEGAIKLARNVDMTCCGLILEKDGRVFEVVPNAYEHCKRRILRINKTATVTKFNTLKDRVEKLVKRGWRLDFDVEKEIATLKSRLEEIQAKEKASQRAASKAFRDAEKAAAEGIFRFDSKMPSLFVRSKSGGFSGPVTKSTALGLLRGLKIPLSKVTLKSDPFVDGNYSIQIHFESKDLEVAVPRELSLQFHELISRDPNDNICIALQNIIERI